MIINGYNFKDLIGLLVVVLFISLLVVNVFVIGYLSLKCLFLKNRSSFIYSLMFMYFVGLVVVVKRMYTLFRPSFFA